MKPGLGISDFGERQECLDHQALRVGFIATRALRSPPLDREFRQRHHGERTNHPHHGKQRRDEHAARREQPCGCAPQDHNARGDAKHARNDPCCRHQHRDRHTEREDGRAFQRCS